MGERPDKPDILKKKKRLKNCHGDGDITYKVDNFESKRCIGNFVSRQFFEYIEMFLAYEKGVLPFPGSLSEQPCKIIEIFGIIRQMRAEKLEEKQKQDKKRGKN